MFTFLRVHPESFFSPLILHFLLRQPYSFVFKTICFGDDAQNSLLAAVPQIPTVSWLFYLVLSNRNWPYLFSQTWSSSNAPSLSHPLTQNETWESDWLPHLSHLIVSEVGFPKSTARDRGSFASDLLRERSQGYWGSRIQQGKQLSEEVASDGDQLHLVPQELWRTENTTSRPGGQPLYPHVRQLLATSYQRGEGGIIS